jgi:transcription-repair coupling factor (superfamily II helicase)
MSDILKSLTGLSSVKSLLGAVNSNLTLTSPLYGASKSLFILAAFEKEKQIILLLPDMQSVSELFVELHLLGLSEYLIQLNEYKAEPLQEKLTEISKREKFIFLSTYDILNCQFPSKSSLESTTTHLSVGGNLSYDDVVEYLGMLHYTKDKFVEGPGDYSQRGSIIDFWSYSERFPVRLEFDGDFLESIRYFDPESQRSIDKIEEATIAAKIDISSDEKRTSLFDYLTNPLIIASSFELNNINDTPFNCFTSTEEKPAKEESPVEEIISEDEFPEPNLELLNAPENSPLPEDKGNLSFPPRFNYPGIRWLVEQELLFEGRIDLNILDAPAISGNYELLFNTLNSFSSSGYRIIITTENELQSQRLKDLLSEYKEQLSDLILSKKVRIETLAIKQGFVARNEKLLLLTDYQIFNKPYRTKITSHKKIKKSKSKTIASIKRGDYVVHEDYGIGKYVGLETIKIGETNQESMKLLYNEGGVVYVNLNYLTLVKKYSSNESLVPTLSTLGSTVWANTKQRTKKRIKEAARELIILYAKRKATQGYSFSHDTIWQKELEASFIYEDTPDQTKVASEVKEDMESINPMDRLVCGDVGFGKTEIAVRAAFKAVQDGKQVALLVPTTILAEQHYNTFKDRLSQFPVKVEALSRFQTTKQQKEILKQLSAGNVDIVIGTHRLLSKDVLFKDLGLLIIDEEHRFGVMAKEKLRSIKLNVDTLTLTATPIPRTLNLSLLGARDLSIIATPPPNRQPIYTNVAVFDIMKIKEWVMNELRRNGQIYFVHDRVQSIDKLAGYLRRYIPDIRIAIAHGQMKPAQLENVIHGFLNREYDILLSTKIIESGIDIPNVNTIIINRADRFGLAELHQLRGRVGRSDKQAYAYFIVPSLNSINKKALRRLQAIEEYTDIGAGFNLSMRDLEIRGAGNLLGTEQSGVIDEVGFDLYVKLINEAVEELKYEEFKEVFKNLPKQEERSEPSIDTFFEIGIPQTYMPEQMDRLNFYTLLYSVKTETELKELQDEMIDRFGALPSLVNRLITAAYLKLYASFALFDRIAIQRNNIFIILPKGQNEEYYKYKFVELMRFIMDYYKDKVKFTQQKDILKLTIINNFENPDKALEWLITFSKQVMNLFNAKIPGSVEN